MSQHHTLGITDYY